MTTPVRATPILPAPASNQSIRELDGLRGIAIAMVILLHLWPREGILAPLARYTDLGWIGVDLFFVISGTLITGILLDSRGRPAYYRNFYARRALRIFPLYYLFLAVVFAVPLVQHGLSGEFVARSGSPLWYAFYLGNVPEAFLGADPPYFVAVLWSLAIEEQFYITFPLIVAALSRRRLTWVLGALVVLAPLVRWGTYLAWPSHERVQYLFTLCRADVIALGGLVAIAVRDPRFRPSRRLVTALLAIAIALVAAAFAWGGLDRTRPFCRVFGYSLLAFSFALLVLWTLMHRGHARAAFLRFAPLCFVGQLCYGLYLLHRPADTLVTRALAKAGISLPAAVQLPIKLAAAVAIAAASFFLFEKPILRLKRAFARDGSAAPRRVPEPVASRPSLA